MELWPSTSNPRDRDRFITQIIDGTILTSSAVAHPPPSSENGNANGHGEGEEFDAAPKKRMNDRKKKKLEQRCCSTPSLMVLLM